jgi:hypothetical protein
MRLDRTARQNAETIAVEVALSIIEGLRGAATAMLAIIETGLFVFMED